MIQTKTISYSGDGANMIGFFAVDDSRSGKRPAVLVAAAAPGLDDYTRERCELLAGLGYAAFGLDFHGNGEVIEAIDNVMARLAPFFADPLRTRARAAAALAALAAQPNVDAARIAAIGYCFGGTIALELARSGADIKAAVAFHGGLSTARAQDAKNIRAKILVLNGADDPVVPREQRAAFEQEMMAGGVDWQLHLYGGVGHSYTRPGVEAMGRPGFAYSKTADERSWQALLNLFAETLGPV
jgi:dienelactone hydrolase